MNATDSLLVPLVDAGNLNGLKHGGLGSRYRFWRDENGVRHVFSVYPADAAPDYPDALAVVTRRTPAGAIAMWAGPAGEAARIAALRTRGDEIHIHVFGDEGAPTLRRLMERASALAPARAAGLPRCRMDRRHAA
ncbi:hypothetical protein K9U40_09675 [Xanthobacter autotrophicus]|uniref:hypothetical protein n=1 Tax=Xanthobacter TaxID=279 RepID=UPI0024AC299C|nr:hypothetical protein [Xanthobacter autotrophicus]MDI4664591.1 hypothetical protein [Xanthobacter autotrophicus]